MAEVARSAISAVPVPHHPPSAFADVQHQPDGGDLNLESLLPADLTFAIEFAQPSRPSKPPAYKPTALPTQLLQPSTSAAVIPPNNPWSYDPSTESCSASTALPSATTCPSHHTTPSLQTSRSVPDRAAFSQGPYRHTSAAPVTSRVQLSPPPPPPPRGASPLSASPLPTSPSGPARTSSSSSSSVSPHQSPVHSRSGYLDYGLGTGSDGYYGGGPPPPPPPPPRDGQSPSGTPCNKNMASDNRSGSLLGKNFARRNSAGSGYNSGPPPPPPPPPRDSQQSSFCTPLDLGSLATSAGDGAVLVTQSSRGTTTPSGAAPSDCWPPPPPPPPPPSKTGTPRTVASVMLQPPPPPPRNDDRLRSRSSSSAAVPYNNNGSYMNGYPSPVMPPPPPPPPPRPATSSDGQLSDGSNSDVNSTGFRAPTLQEAQMLVAAALQDGTDDSLAAALELANKLQTLAAQRIASVPNGNTRQSPPLQGPNPYGSCVVNTNRNSVPLGGGSASRGSSYPGQLSGMGSGAPPPLPPPSPLQPTESGRLANVGSGQVGLYGRGSTTPRGVYGSTVPPPPPPPPPRSPANSLLPTTGSQPMLPPPPPPPPRAPVPQSPSPEVAAVMAALPEVRSPFALYQRSSDSDYCPTPPDEPALKVDQLSHVNSTTFPAASNPAATASTASPYGNPYSGMFGSMLGTPFGAPLSGAYSGTVVGAASAFGSGAFGSEVYATPASTTVPGGCDTSQEVSLASLASLLTTLAALAKQGGSGSAVVGSGQTTLSRDAVFAAYASGSNSATAPSTTATMASHAANVGLEAKPAAILESPSPQQRLSLAGGSDKGSEVEAFRSPSPPVALSSASGVASPGGSSGGSCDTMTTPGSSPSELLPINGVEDVSSKPHSPIEAATSGVASPVGEKAAAVEAHEPATAAPGTLVSSNGSGAAPIPAANCNGLSGVSLATLQQAIALLSAGFPSSATSSAPASSTFMPEYSGPNPLNVTAEAGVVGMALTAAVPLSAAVMSPSDGVTAEELQMAKSLHAALKVVALLESLSGTSCVARA